MSNKMTYTQLQATMDILDEVQEERESQHSKWGEQNHPDGTSNYWVPASQIIREECEAAFAEGNGTWRHILQEEVFEVYAEDDVDKLREELIQVAAVAVAWIEAIDRRKDKVTDE